MKIKLGKTNAKQSRLQGFVFSLDATLAFFLFMVFAITISFFSLQGDIDPYGKLQVARVGRDTLFALDKSGVLLTNNRSLIESAINSTLPQSINMNLEVRTYYYDHGAFYLINISKYGPEPPSEESSYGLRYDYVGMKNRQVVNFSIVNSVVWQK